MRSMYIFCPRRSMPCDCGSSSAAEIPPKRSNDACRRGAKKCGAIENTITSSKTTTWRMRSRSSRPSCWQSGLKPSASMCSGSKRILFAKRNSIHGAPTISLNEKERTTMMDMLALLPENSKNRYDSRHRLVIAASQRAKQIMQGSRPTIQTKFTKETTMAIDEMVQGRLEFLTGKEARQAMKDLKRMRETEFERIATSATTLGEDAREIKKELSVY